MISNSTNALKMQCDETEYDQDKCTHNMQSSKLERGYTVEGDAGTDEFIDGF